ncbi:MAG: UPF0104 family protein [Burkholderiaceae bacterium]|nr:UPF0104 family protein [Burkholderiaceae bacterium]
MARAWKLAPTLLAVVVLGLVARQAVRLDWGAVTQALSALPWSVLAGAAVLAAAGHAAFAGFDVLARAVVRHRAGWLRSAWIGATSYAMNLNLGALIGGVAMRLDLYRRAGVAPAQAAQVVGFGMVANWCGWALLAAAVVQWAQPLPWPPTWALPGNALRQGLTAALLVVPTLVLLLCGLRQRLPAAAGPLPQALAPWPLALAGMALAVVSWALAATTLWWLLQGGLPWWSVAGALLLAAVAGAATHVPGGLGVLEAVVLATLSGTAAPGTLLAALLAYRAVYYGLPLLWATGSYAGLLVQRGHSGSRLGTGGSERMGLAHAVQRAAARQGAT